MDSDGIQEFKNCSIPTIRKGYGSPVVKVADPGRHVVSSSPVPLKTRHPLVGNELSSCFLNKLIEMHELEQDIELESLDPAE
ncbi:hypothetical protein TNCV_5008241 [Trichonephila clavipes]|nr:hypothetical protein TNCV_5008241 [Trichonephila clavipes]